MKRALLFTVVFASVMGLPNAFAKDATCKVKTNDIGTIVGKGPDEATAFDDAATKCFDRYSLLHKAKYNRGPAEEEVQLVWIDTCANIKCGG